MATTGKNNVSLVIEAGVTGEAQIRALADDVKRLAREGADAAPEFAALAAQLDRLGDQAASLATFKTIAADVERLTATQVEAAAATDKLNARLQEAQGAAAPLVARQRELVESSLAAKKSIADVGLALANQKEQLKAGQLAQAAFDSQQRESKLAREEAKALIAANNLELGKLKPALDAATSAESALASQYRASQGVLDKANEELRRRNQALRDADAAVLAAGASTTDLVAAETALLTATQKIAQETQRLTRVREDAAAYAKELAALDAASLVAQEKQQAQLLRTVEAYEREEQALRESAAAAALAEQATREKAAADALAVTEAQRLAAETRELEFAQNRLAAAARLADLEFANNVKSLRDAALATEAKRKADLESIEALARKTATTKLAAEATAKLAAEEAEAAAFNRKVREEAEKAEQSYRELVASLKAVEKATEDYVEASVRAASADRQDAAAMQARVKAAQDLIEAERRLTDEQRDAATVRNINRVALLGEAQALAQVAAASRETQAATVAAAQAARQAGAALDQAFGSVGIRSISAIEAEIEQTGAALARLGTQARAGSIGLDDLNRAAGAAEAKIARLRAEILQVQAAPSEFDRLTNGINGLITRFAGLGAAIATVGVAVRPIIEEFIKLEQVTRVLTTVTGSAEVAAQQIDFLRTVAQQSGQQFGSLAESYAKFAASALQTGLSITDTQEVFQSVALAAGNLGLSTDQAKRALEALSQIASKGQVSMEELRQQLGDALPGVLPLLAKELGLTTQELNKVVESGGLLANEAIPAIGRALQALGTQGGTRVEGLVANFNRFLNVVKQTGTEIIDGPFGRATGVVLTAFAGALRDIATVAVFAQEGIRRIGETIGVTAAAIANGTIGTAEYREELNRLSDESGARLASFTKTAYGAAEANDELAGAVSRATTAGGAQSKSLARLALDNQKLTDATIERARAAEKNVEAAKAEGEALTRAADLTGNEIEQRRASVAAAEKLAAAKINLANADLQVVAALTQARDKTVEELRARKTSDEQIKLSVDAYNKLIDARKADAKTSGEQAEAARAAAAQARLAAAAVEDNAGRYKEFAAEVEKASKALNVVIGLYAKDEASTEEVQRATLALAEAKGKLKDALNDQDAASKRVVDALKAEADFTKAQLELELTRLRIKQQELIALGNKTAADRLGIQIAELQLQVTASGTQAKRDEATEIIRSTGLRLNELRAQNLLTPALEQELQTRIKQQQAILLQTTASEANEAQQKKEIEAQRNGAAARGTHTSTVETNTSRVRENTGAMQENERATRSATTAQQQYAQLLRDDPRRLVGGDGLAGIGPAQDGVNFGVRSPGQGLSGAPLPSDFRGPSGSTRTEGAGQAVNKPDGSGWYYTTDVYKVQVPGQDAQGRPLAGGWALAEGGTAGGGGASAADRAALGLPPLDPRTGLPVPSSAVAPAPRASQPAQSAPRAATPTSYNVNVTIGGQNFSIGATDKASADATIRALEEAYRAGGGS